VDRQPDRADPEDDDALNVIGAAAFDVEGGRFTMSILLRGKAPVSLASLLLAPALAACGPGDESLGVARQRAIYGADDRVEVRSLDEADPARAVAFEAVAALVPLAQLRKTESGVNITGPTWAEERNLCDDVRFAQQPVVARCSAVLVDDDLVLTAGHCARLCSVTRIVFGVLYESPSTLRPLTDDDVFACVDVVADETTGDGVDFAWLRLDRPVGPARRPVALRLVPPSPGESLALIGFPAGVPMKADHGGVVTGAGDGVFFTSHDAFHSSSGGPLLDDAGRLIGILGGGAPDLVLTARGCNAPVDATSLGGVERSTAIAPALARLCGSAPCDPLCRHEAEARNCDGTGEGADQREGCTVDGTAGHRRQGPSAWLAVFAGLAVERRRRRQDPRS